MNFKTKLTKKAISLLLLVVMVLTLSANIGFSAFATEQQEIDFCIDKMKNLPTDEKFLKETLTLPSENELNESREEPITHSDGTTEKVGINEKKCYQEIQDVVTSLTKDFKDQTGSKLSANIQKAGAIYRWVAKKIHYDHETYDAIANPEKTLAKCKPQDAYFVFTKETGVCEGYARLLNLMMRMAGVPCMYVVSICGPEENYGHAFNAVYVEEESDDRKGWTLLDSCWAAPNSDGNEKIKRYLSGEYFFAEMNLALALGTENNEYKKAICDEFKAAKDYYKNENKEQLIADFNEKSREVLKKLNGKYKDCAHFETIKFVEQFGGLYFKYKTDLTMEQAKKALDESKIKVYRDFLNGTLPSCLVAVLEDIESADSLKDRFARYNLQYCRYINEEEFMGEVDGYIDELKTVCANCIFGHLKDIENSIEQINNKINDGLKELNEKYKNINKFSEIKLIYNKSTLPKDVSRLSISVKTDLSEENLKERLISYVDSQGCKFAEFFPAYYKPGQSLEEANRSIASHVFHKVSKFEAEPGATINSLQLDPNSHEGNAKIRFSDYCLKCDFAEYFKQDPIEKLYKYGLPICVTLFWRYEKLTLKDIEFIPYFDLAIKEIDVSNSSRYVLEDDVLYEKMDGGEKKTIMKLYNGAYRTIEYIQTEESIKNGTFVT